MRLSEVAFVVWIGRRRHLRTCRFKFQNCRLHRSFGRHPDPNSPASPRPWRVGFRQGGDVGGRRHGNLAALYSLDKLGRAVLHDLDGTLDGFLADIELLSGLLDGPSKVYRLRCRRAFLGTRGSKEVVLIVGLTVVANLRRLACQVSDPNGDLSRPRLAFACDRVAPSRYDALAGQLLAPVSAFPNKVRKQAFPFKLDEPRRDTGYCTCAVSVPRPCRETCPLGP